MERIDLDYLYDLRVSGLQRILQFCMDLGVVSSSYECPKCGKPMKMQGRSDLCDQFEWACRERVGSSAHRVKRSIRSGSWMAESHFSIFDILRMTYFFVNELPQKFIRRELKISHDSVCDWRNGFREICMLACVQMNEAVGGEDAVVELVECEFGKHKYNYGNWIFSGIERDTKKCFFRVVKTKDKEALLSVVETCILPGTTVYSNCWKSYKCLEDEGFQHLAANKSIRFENNNLVENTLAAVKRSMPRQKHNATDQFDSYLGEYLWRCSHTDTEDLMRAFLEAVNMVHPPRTQDLPSVEAEN